MSGPLEGIRVLDFSHGVAGPYGTMILADLGADVIKIEKPGRGDPTRYMNVSKRFQAQIPDSGGDYFLAINRNKRSVTLDLDSKTGHDLALRLASRADIAVQSFRPGVMSRLGLDYPSLRAVNPDLIYASLTAYGDVGPLAGQPGMDVAVQARSGVMSITGRPGDEPVKPGSSLADFAGGAHLAIGILGALIAKLRGGSGQAVSVSLLDATMMMLANYSVAVLDGHAQIQPMGSGHPQLVPFQAFPTADSFIVIATGTNKLFRELCKVIGLDHLAVDPRFQSNPNRVIHRDELVGILSDLLRTRTRAAWQETFERHGIPSAPVQTLEQAFTDPQLRANEMVVEIDHSVYGSIHQLGVPYKFDQSRCAVRKPPPVLGQDTADVLNELLGVSSAEVAQFRADGFV